MENKISGEVFNEISKFVSLNSKYSAILQENPPNLELKLKNSSRFISSENPFSSLINNQHQAFDFNYKIPKYISSPPFQGSPIAFQKSEIMQENQNLTKTSNSLNYSKSNINQNSIFNSYSQNQRPYSENIENLLIRAKINDSKLNDKISTKKNNLLHLEKFSNNIADINEEHLKRSVMEKSMKIDMILEGSKIAREEAERRAIRAAMKYSVDIDPYYNQKNNLQKEEISKVLNYL